MKRRGYLVACVTGVSAALAGCSFTINDGSGEDGSDGDENGSDGDGNGDDPAESETSADESLATSARDLEDDDSAEDLLPKAPEEWDATEQGRPASIIGADGRAEGTYTDPDGGRYVVEVIRWPSESRAEDRGYDREEGWMAHVVVETVTLAIQADDDGDEGTAIGLLAASPVLSVDLIESENRL